AKVDGGYDLRQSAPFYSGSEVISADINKDGVRDLIAFPNAHGIQRFTILPGRRDAGLNLPEQLPNITFDRAIAADLDGDGKLDLLGRVGCGAATCLQVFRGDGTGHFLDGGAQLPYGGGSSQFTV